MLSINEEQHESSSLDFFTHHQNWRISLKSRNRDINKRYDTQAMFLDRLRLDKSVHASICSSSPTFNYCHIGSVSVYNK